MKPLLTTLLLVACVLTACAAEPDQVRVTTVIDGDTVILDNGETVRLLGINAPEQKFDGRPAEPFALEATLLLRELVEGKQVSLTVGRTKKDKYGRTLGYLDLSDGTDLHEQLIERGYAFAVAFPPDIDRLATYKTAEASARKERRGVWGDPYYTPVAANKTAAIKGGFGLVTGKVTTVKRSKKNVRLIIGKAMVVGIRHAAWDEFWGYDADDLKGRMIVARGWINEGKKGGPAYLRVRHPAMMDLR